MNATESQPLKPAEAAATPRTRPGVEIVYRRPDFGDFDGLPKFWAGGSPAASFAVGLFSLVIPEGEKFFIRSVNALRSEVKDPELLEDVKAFAKQEAAHTRVHMVFNEALRKHGFDPDDATDTIKRFFETIEKYFTKRMALAVTVFAEHLTALGAEVEFRFPELRQGVEPRASNFWRWHAAEELEHKAVAFDVFKAAGGGYFTRVFTVLLFGLMWALMTRPMIRRQIAGFKKVRTAERAVSSKALVTAYPDLVPRLRRFTIRYLLSFFRPGFHPWQVDSRRYLEAWKLESENEAVAYG
ncbi:MAG: metal-dependent hydrolase [Myxococcales bacterium]|nr:metal-dependent hydrolase [Myxococcales bacterium]